MIKFLSVYQCDTSLRDILVYSTFAEYQEKEQPSTFPFQRSRCATPDNWLIRSSSTELYNKKDTTHSYTTTSFIYTTDHLYKMPSYVHWIHWSQNRRQIRWAPPLRGRSPLTTPISFVFAFFCPPGRTFEPSRPQLYQRHVFLCGSNNSNELVIRRHQKRKEEIGLIFAQPFYRVE